LITLANIDPHYADACYNKGIALARLSKYDEALAALSKAL
jgi:tetratricopeptide (TPR) repeat protein